MRGWLIFIATLAIVCAALAIILYRPLLQKGSEEPGRSKQRIASAEVRENTTVEVREGKVLVDGKPFSPAGEVVSVTVADGKVYVNGRCVSRGKPGRVLLRAYPEGSRELEQPGKESQEFPLKRWIELVPPPPPWLTEREREEFKRDIQKWQRRFQERFQRQPAEQRERELDARRKEMLNELDRIQQQAEQLGKHLKELQKRSGAGEKAPPPFRNPEMAEPRRFRIPERDDQTAEKMEKYLERLFEMLERSEESIRPRLEEFLEKAEKMVDQRIEKFFDRYLEKKLSEEDIIGKAVDRLIERMGKNLPGKKSPAPAREKDKELKKPAPEKEMKEMEDF